jgi:hypothetical protein
LLRRLALDGDALSLFREVLVEDLGQASATEIG